MRRRISVARSALDKVSAGMVCAQGRKLNRSAGRGAEKIGCRKGLRPAPDQTHSAKLRAAMSARESWAQEMESVFLYRVIAAPEAATPERRALFERMSTEAEAQSKI